jgi:hypothetical protein
VQSLQWTLRRAVSSPQLHWKTDTQYITAYDDEGEVCTANIEGSVAMQHERPFGVDLTPGKQLLHRCNGREELILATVHLVTQKLWGAYLDAPSALLTKVLFERPAVLKSSLV